MTGVQTCALPILRLVLRLVLLLLVCVWLLQHSKYALVVTMMMIGVVVVVVVIGAIAPIGPFVRENRP